ncbi:hypothetical protein [Nostoc favosum]|uniref:Uncharacterized protein n=1 Tax=Nostoc favosum CHAB5714 TaxID=2780399 RepID=A0ABS8I471_9NOSO|nr:hypothetical protein [Nostoc favosum]MCC5598946.1 hypothetical protein [Nostoc favosum CHAB5714]
MQKQHIEKINEILLRYFCGSRFLGINPTMDNIPLVAANLQKSTHSFSEGQLLYIYNGFWGMNERVQVVGRHRRKHRLILGVCPIKSLSNFRPKLVYEPAVIRKLHGECIDGGIFMGFFDLPGEFVYIKDYIQAIR